MSGRVFTFEINRTTSAPAAPLFRLETDGAISSTTALLQPDSTRAIM
jgi:hypothetical protein